MGVIVTLFIIVVSICVLFIIIFLVGRIREILGQRARRRSIMRQIDGKSFTFHKTYQVGCYDLMTNLHQRLRAAGIKNLCFTFENVLTCKRKGVRWLIFDAGYGRKLKKQAHFIATYFQAEIPETLPKFSVMPLRGRPAPDDRISFKDRTFMRQYAVQSDDDKTEKLITPALQKVLLSLPIPFSIQAGEHLLQIHVLIKDAKPELLLDLFASAEKVCELLRQ
jgi:hypothetical protein